MAGRTVAAGASGTSAARLAFRWAMPLLLAFALALLLGLSSLPAAAQAGWGPPVAVSPAGQDTRIVGLAAPGDRPALLLARTAARRTVLLELRTTDARGRLGAPRPIARSANAFEGQGLYAAAGGDLVAGWLEIVSGSRRPVVATGPRLADRQVLAPGPRSSQIMAMAANRRGDAVVSFIRYKGSSGEQLFAAYRRAGGRFGTPQLIDADARGGWPRVAIDERGAAAVAWTKDHRLEVAERPAGATAFGAPAIASGGARVVSMPALAAGHGRLVAAWVAGGGGRPGGLQVAVRTAGQPAWSNTTTLSPRGARLSGSDQPTAAIDGDRTLVGWIQGHGPHSVHDAAALAIRTGGGRWTAPVTRGVTAPQHVGLVRLVAPAPGRPPLLLFESAPRRTVATATVRADGGLAPTRTIDVGPDEPDQPIVAHGARHTWLGVGRWDRHALLERAALLRSTS